MHFKCILIIMIMLRISLTNLTCLSLSWSSLHWRLSSSMRWSSLWASISSVSSCMLSGAIRPLMSACRSGSSRCLLYLSSCWSWSRVVIEVSSSDLTCSSVLFLPIKCPNTDIGHWLWLHLTHMTGRTASPHLNKTSCVGCKQSHNNAFDTL